MKGEKVLNLMQNGRELTSYDTALLLPICCISHDFAAAAYDRVGWHWHDEIQFYLTMQGEMEIWVEQERYRLLPGQALFINAGRVHCCHPLKPESRLWCPEVHPTALDEAGGALYRAYIAPMTECSAVNALLLSRNTVRRLSCFLEETTRKQPLAALRYRAHLLLLWQALLQEAPLQQAEETLLPHRNSRLKEIFAFIQAHYAESLTLERIAEQIHLSRSECSRYFRKAAGQPLFSYLNQYRIERSLLLLEQSECSIAEIAANVGFSSQSYYTAQFRRSCGQTPGQYRKQYRQRQNQ